tara:strand:+ start:477 stop:806 length:330 start_codon:yes stop_codon:yes gene_type:complete
VSNPFLPSDIFVVCIKPRIITSEIKILSKYISGKKLRDNKLSVFHNRKTNKKILLKINLINTLSFNLSSAIPNNKKDITTNSLSKVKLSKKKTKNKEKKQPPDNKTFTL